MPPCAGSTFWSIRPGSTGPAQAHPAQACGPRAALPAPGVSRAGCIQQVPCQSSGIVLALLGMCRAGSQHVSCQPAWHTSCLGCSGRAAARTKTPPPRDDKRPQSCPAPAPGPPLCHPTAPAPFVYDGLTAVLQGLLCQLARFLLPARTVPKDRSPCNFCQINYLCPMACSPQPVVDEGADCMRVQRGSPGRVPCQRPRRLVM